MEFGFGMAKCVFNMTYQMNATIIDSNTIVCDPPAFEYHNSDMWYNISVTLDGTDYSNSDVKFFYYEEPVINAVEPWMGPLTGQTMVTLKGRGFTHKNICAFKVRFEE
jgi:hypothetical protein